MVSQLHVLRDILLVKIFPTGLMSGTFSNVQESLNSVPIVLMFQMARSHQLCTSKWHGRMESLYESTNIIAWQWD